MALNLKAWKNQSAANAVNHRKMTKRYYTIFNLIVLTAIIYTAVNMIYKATRSHVTPVYTDDSVRQEANDVEGQKKLPLSNFGPITDRNLFGSIDKSSEEETEDAYKDVKVTSMDLTLLGTVSGDRHTARAVIEETGKRKQDLYKVGDSIQDAVVDKILRGQVILRVEDRYEKLTMKEPTSPEASPASRRKSSIRSQRLSRSPMGRTTTITVNRKDIQESLQDINQLLTQVRIQPHYQNGQADGLAISRIQRGSIFSKLGMRNGDIIQKIDGKGLNSPEEIFDLYEKLKEGSQASLQISRRGRARTLNYRFK